MEKYVYVPCTRTYWGTMYVDVGVINMSGIDQHSIM